MAEKPETQLNLESPLESLAYRKGRRDALLSFYNIVQTHPNLLRDEVVEILRKAILDAERRVRDISENNT